MNLIYIYCLFTHQVKITRGECCLAPTQQFVLLSVVTECSSIVLRGTIHKAMEFELVLRIFRFLLAYLSFSLFYFVMMTMLCLNR